MPLLFDQLTITGSSNDDFIFGRDNGTNNHSIDAGAGDDLVYGDTTSFIS